MALTTPILYTINAFDATNSQIFKFNILGGNQVTGSTLIIRNNATLDIVYSEPQISFRFEYVLPANTLTNGAYYQATLTTQDAQGNSSSESIPIQFYCFTRPEFVISNIPAGNIISNSSFSFNAIYNQIQGEILNAYVFNLYSASGALISTSGTQYNTKAVFPLTLSYVFSGFEDKTEYSIEVTGVTAYGTKITTNRIDFVADYISPNTYSTLFLNNNCSGGYITIKSNIIPIDGKTNPEDPIYINNDEIDLRQNGNYVLWDDGYVIDGDWTMRLWGRDFMPNSQIVQISNINLDNIFITYCEDNDDCWFELKVIPNGDLWGYTIESPHISLPTNNEQLFCWVRRIKNIYEFKIENRGVEN